MEFKGFFISHQNQKGFDKIVTRIKELGINVYKYYKCMPQYIITVKKPFIDYQRENQILYFKCDNLNFDKMHILGFGFEGLFEDEEKIKEIEDFGKYRCIIKEIDDNIPNDYISVETFDFY